MIWRPANNEWEFTEIISKFEDELQRQEATNDEKIACYKFAIDALKADIAGSTVANGVYLHKPEDDKDGIPFPAEKIQSSGTQTLNLKEHTVLAIPWAVDRIIDSVKDIEREGLNPNKNNIVGHYFPEIDLIYISSGRHHTAVASLRDGGEIQVEVKRLSDAFALISTDGVEWFVEKPEKYCIERTPVHDIRFALMYDFAKRIWMLTGC